MLLLILTIQLSTLLYIWSFKSSILLNQEQMNLEHQLENSEKRLMYHLERLQKELTFLSELEVMDDIVANDVDKRIDILLKKKAEDLGEEIILVALRDNHPIASSKINYDIEKHLLFLSPIFASFEREKRLGSLMLLYPYHNFSQLKVDNPHQQLWLRSKFIGNIPHIFNPQESIVVSMQLEGKLKGWELFLSHEKEDAFHSIREIEKILFGGFLFSLILLIVVVWVLSRRQIEIVEHTQEVLALKRQFLSTMSHELRTPLGSILNLTQHLMVSPNLNDANVDMLKRIENASEHLLSMINNLLQLSKLESNSMSVQKERHDIVRLIEEIVEIVEPLIYEKNLAFFNNIPNQPIFIETDAHHFQQIIMNLLSNAIKYTHQGNITIRLKKEGSDYLLAIKDTGIGIEREKQEALFSEFYQAHLEKGSIKHSTGLGLALSQKVAHLINGNITIKSEGLGKGCEADFKFTSL
jgi:signal transduction histidine kinase